MQTPVGAVTIKQGNFPQIWVADAAQNNITRISMQMISVTPDLPAGLRFNPFTGRVDGTAKATAPSTTYTAIVYSDLGNDTTTFTFEVTSTANISNSTGSSTTSSNHKDGLTVKYFNPSNCEKLIEVVDSVGGTSPGNTEVTQEIFPIISVFAGDSLVRRVTEIIAENPEADATIKLFYSYQDIDLYNQSVGNPLSNDTAGGTMQVAALQLHKRPNGSIEVIKHSPITANWVSKDQNWVAEYTITKFSSFYLGDSNTINAFDCSSSGSTSVTACGSYTSPSGRHTWTTSGTYIDTIANTTSCDSVLTINLTVNPAVDISVTQTGVTLTANATNATYQWLDCDNGFAVITGETNQSFTPTTDGNYAVAITKNGCTVNSACYNVITSGILSLSSEDELIGNIYPNPNSGTFTLSLNKSLQNGKVEVLNSVGQVIYTNNSSAKQQFIELNDAEQGFYFIKITSNDYQAVKRMIVNK